MSNLTPLREYKWSPPFLPCVKNCLSKISVNEKNFIEPCLKSWFMDFGNAINIKSSGEAAL